MVFNAIKQYSASSKITIQKIWLKNFYDML